MQTARIISQQGTSTSASKPVLASAPHVLPVLHSSKHRAQVKGIRVPAPLPVPLGTPLFRTSGTLCSATGPAGSAGPTVTVTVEKPSFNARRLFAYVDIRAPLESVWNALTDYENLSDFIPSLVENKCLERKERSAVLYQVGAQDVALGIKFAAKCKLECTEYLDGVPEWLITPNSDDNDVLFPTPKTSSSSSSHSSSSNVKARDITFRLLEGDFKAFKGVWRMQYHPDSTGKGISVGGTRLCYSLYVQPQPWLPAGLIQGRIEQEVSRNLAAVRQHAEAVAAAAKRVAVTA